jgi:hypothetical protein
VDACHKAMQSRAETCDWVGPSGIGVADECRGVFVGALAEGAKCRSNLECADGMACHDLGLTTKGTCGKPRQSGACMQGNDPLAPVLAHENLMQRPFCQGYCSAPKCLEAVPVGGDCTRRFMCGPNRTCVGGKCVDAPPPKVGEACPGGECLGNAQCLRGTCIDQVAGGKPCQTDRECVAGSCKDGVCRTMCAHEAPPADATSRPSAR